MPDELRRQRAFAGPGVETGCAHRRSSGSCLPLFKEAGQPMDGEIVLEVDDRNELFQDRRYLPRDYLRRSPVP